MLRSFDELERKVFLAFEQALADKRLDVADHLLYALEALDPECEGPAIRRACRSILDPGSAVEVAEDAPPETALTVGDPEPRRGCAAPELRSQPGTADRHFKDVPYWNQRVQR